MNMPVPNDPELDALLGAYALDALEPDERTRVDAYLARNARARVEVDELRESAASLALAPVEDTAAPAPPGLWDRISFAIEEDLAPGAGPSAGEPDEIADRRAQRNARWMPWIVAAAALVVAVLVTQVVSLNHRLDNTPTGENAAVSAFARAARVNGARKVSLAPAAGPAVARVVLLPDGSGYLKNDSLTPLDANHTYQLWVLTGAADHPVAISAGVLGSDPKAAAFRTDTGVHGFAITVEEKPGVGQSKRQPVATATVT
jgi:anti-sigma-K factor RskA